MKQLLPLLAFILLPFCSVQPAMSLPSEHHSMNGDDITESAMQQDLLQMLADFSTYIKADYQPCVEPNNQGETCGCFKGENTMGSDEKGVRPNADLSMICAFLVKYGQGKVNLPKAITWDEMQKMAMESLIFAYSTHKANRLKPCKGNRYWGSTSQADHAWESSLWAMSVAYSAFFQWNRLNEEQRGYIYRLLKAECNYELERDIPTGFKGDTKSEENGWEANVLAVTLGLFPQDPLAPQWFARLREFAINSYSQRDDATDETVIDPDYDQTRVKDLYRGANLYDDFTLQNHNYFHTSYQNAAIQELGEAALALRLFQQTLYGEERWKTNALMHNNQRVMDEVLYWLALSDGELAMPNGNDWSLFLYDQITSYTTNACFLRDPQALMLERLAYQMIKARQQTTADGSWLLRADVGARRMGVQAHRVMMTWLMHHLMPTTDLEPTRWDDFVSKYSAAKVFTSQNTVRAMTPERFTCFSWSNGLKSYTGYISPNLHPRPSTLNPQTSTLKPQTSNLIVPFSANNTGNFIGWYEVKGHKTNAKPVVAGNYELAGNSFVMNGELETNDSALNNRFAIYSTPGNAVIYIDDVRANKPCLITREKGGLMAVSVDEFTTTTRTFHTARDSVRLDGSTLTKMNGPWVNIDNRFGIITYGNSQMAFGEKTNNKSIHTARLYAAYDDRHREAKKGESIGSRAFVYYSNTDAATTARQAKHLTPLNTEAGWKGVITFDPDESAYLLLSNFRGTTECTLHAVSTHAGAPVFTVPTTINDHGSTAIFHAEKNHSIGKSIFFFIEGSLVEACQKSDDDAAITLRNLAKKKNTVVIHAYINGRHLSKQVKLDKKSSQKTVRFD